MRTFTLSIIALVLSLTLQNFGGNSSADFELFRQDSLSSMPRLNVNHVQSQDGKSSSKIKLIAQVDLWFFSALHTEFKSPQSFDHYLPIYSLNRKKEYFLLI